MRARRIAIRSACRTALLLAALAPGGAAVAQNTLQDCSAITDAAARLACYDRLAGHAGSGAPEPAAAATPPGTAAPAAIAPSVPSAAPGPAAAVSAPAPAAAPGAAVPAAAPPKGSFGLYVAEHPAPPPATAELTARVTALGVSEAGRMTVALEGGAVWELESEADRLLAVGDTVDIRRATLGSFLMVTPSKRMHRVRRLR